jgi:hypothetical protein
MSTKAIAILLLQMLMVRFEDAAKRSNVGGRVRVTESRLVRYCAS